MCFEMNYYYTLSLPGRTQVDYVFALRENIISNLSKLWKFFFGMFTNFDDFVTTFKALTENNSCIVIDNTVKSNQIADCVFWYKAKLDLPEFKIGRSRYWSMSKKVYRTEEEKVAEHESEMRAQVVSTKITRVEKEDVVDEDEI